MSTRLTVQSIQSGIALLTFVPDSDGEVVLDAECLRQLDVALSELTQPANASLNGLVVRSGGALRFAAPVDLAAVKAGQDWSVEQVAAYCQRGREVLQKLSRTAFPTAALIELDTLGSGLELALWCDYRIAAGQSPTGAVPQVGLPQVDFGLLPTWAGSALLPRVIGSDAAVDLITSGRSVGVDQAKSWGLVSEVTTASHLQEAAVKRLSVAAESQEFLQVRQQKRGSVAATSATTGQAMAEPIADRHGSKAHSNADVLPLEPTAPLESTAPLAPTVALEHMTRSCGMELGLDLACQSETEAVSQVWGSPAGRGLLHYQTALAHNRKSPGLVDMQLPTKEIKNVGVVGAGLMGASIATICCDAGLNVWLLDADEAVAQAAALEIQQQQEKQQQEKPQQNAGSVRWTADYLEFAQCELVIESVVETVDVKKIVFKKIEAAVGPETLIASNTSAIPIEKLASFLTHPERCCGIHFCHPELMALVEVVSGPDSAKTTIATAVRFVQAIEKIPVAMNDSPGFVVNRLLASFLNAALTAFGGGVSIVEIDAALRGFGFLAGPFQIIDVIGVDTCMYAGRTMWESGLDCVSLSPILPKLMKNGRFGRKSGRGFYEYPTAGAEGVWGPAVGELINGYREQTEADREAGAHVNAEQLAEQLLAAVAVEARKIILEEIVDSPLDIELCIVNGFSFPCYQGGIVFWDENRACQDGSLAANPLKD